MIAHLNFERDKFLNIIDNENYLYRVRFNSFIYEPDNAEKVFFFFFYEKVNVHIGVLFFDEVYFNFFFDFFVFVNGE